PLCLVLRCSRHHRDLHSFPTRRSSDLGRVNGWWCPLNDSPATAGQQHQARTKICLHLLKNCVHRGAGRFHIGGQMRGAEECGFKDRKSTRLNSSHVKISYAVFCLKKKK